MKQGVVIGFSPDQDGIKPREHLWKLAHNLIVHQNPIGGAVRAGDEIIEAVRKGIDYFSHFLSFQSSGFHRMSIRTPSLRVRISTASGSERGLLKQPLDRSHARYRSRR